MLAARRNVPHGAAAVWPKSFAAVHCESSNSSDVHSVDRCAIPLRAATMLSGVDHMLLPLTSFESSRLANKPGRIGGDWRRQIFRLDGEDILAPAFSFDETSIG